MRKWYVILLALAVSAFLLPVALNAQTPPSIQLVKPADRHNVALGKNDAVVAIQGADLQAGYTWQLFVDGVPEGTRQTTTSFSFVLTEPTGPHRLKAVLYDPAGVQVASGENLVLAAPVETKTDVFNRSWFVPFMVIFMLCIVALIFFALRIRLRHAS